MKLILKILILICSLFFIVNAYAFNWDSLWLRPDQQAARALAEGHNKRAAELFENPAWRAVAYYRSQEFVKTINVLKADHSALGQYNLGNALALTGQYKKAIQAYTKSLALKPNNKDARYNLELLKKLLKQQKKQAQKNKQQLTKNNRDNKKNKNHSKQDKKSQPNLNTAKNKNLNRQHQLKNKYTHLKNWLQHIPDDPGGLLRQKFLRDHQRMQDKQISGWW